MFYNGVQMMGAQKPEKRTDPGDPASLLPIEIEIHNDPDKKETVNLIMNEPYHA